MSDTTYLALAATATTAGSAAESASVRTETKYHISSNIRRGVYFKLLKARKAYIRGRHLLEGGAYFFRVPQGRAYNYQHIFNQGRGKKAFFSP